MGTNADYAAVVGGLDNAVGNSAAYAFAAGYRAKANHPGALVWGDSTAADIASTNNNSVTMRAAGGYRLFSNSGPTLGAHLAPNATTWSALSDRNAKENFEPIDTAEILEKVPRCRRSRGCIHRSGTRGQRLINCGRKTPT